ncbi:hypothetical protein [Pseudomonas sp. GM50]|uniref:hypothetical protein n=1 Tax=Pseudomonas sp. GM50 TaxID=1144332 RepID=UPI001EE65A91|nr:hypothetical protein [Pseudomonas sp. GM50]
MDPEIFPGDVHGSTVMAESQYKKLQGMELAFVSGVLEENSLERAIGYSVTFRMSLDFTHFVLMANQYIKGYLNDPLNAIRPELGGLAYHYSYNYFFGAAGSIKSSLALFEVFTNPLYYMTEWSAGTLQRRYGKPGFAVVDGKLQVTARMDFRRKDKRPMLIGDLPVIQFGWALNLMQGHKFSFPLTAPATVVVLGYAEEDFVAVGDTRMRRGTRYMVGRELQFGAINPKQILTAG